MKTWEALLSTVRVAQQLSCQSGGERGEAEGRRGGRGRNLGGRPPAPRPPPRRGAGASGRKPALPAGENRSAPSGPERAATSAASWGVWGGRRRGRGNSLLGEGAFPAESPPGGPIAFDEGRTGRRDRALGREWVPPAREGEAPGSQQRPRGSGVRARAGWPPGCAGKRSGTPSGGRGPKTGR